MAGSTNGPSAASFDLDGQLSNNDANSETSSVAASEDSSVVEAPAHKPPRIILNVRDLRRRLGQRREEPIEVTLATQKVIGSWTDDYPVTGQVVIESIERGITMFGAVTFRWRGECRRCLEETGGEQQIEIAEIFQVRSPEDSEVSDFDGDQIDLVPVVCDAVALSLPLAPLCRNDCAGPDPDRYPAMTIQQSEEAKEVERAKQGPDPRWAALSDLNLTEGD